MRTTPPLQYRDAPVDVRLVLSSLWIAMLFVFAYVDLFAFYRADVLEAALAGTVEGTTFVVNQVFLTGTLVYILLPVLMVVLSLVLRPRLNRTANIVVGVLYAVSIVVSCIGEQWVYYLLGSAVEVVLLGVIVRSAWRWPYAETVRP